LHFVCSKNKVGLKPPIFYNTQKKISTTRASHEKIFYNKLRNKTHGELENCNAQLIGN